MRHAVKVPLIIEESGEFKLPGSFYISEDYKRIIELDEMGLISKHKDTEILKKPSTAKKVTKDADKD